MSKLPTVPRSVHEASIQGLPDKLIYSPFRIADKRNLLSAISFRDAKMFIQTVVEIVRANTNLEEMNCMQMHFIEAAFMKVYAASQGGMIEAEYTCSAIVDGGEGGESKECGAVTPIRIPIDDVDIDFGNLEPGKEHTIYLGDDLAVVVATPEWEVVQKFLSEEHTINVNDSYVLSCVKEVHGPEGVAKRGDFTEKELKDWIEGLDSTYSDKFSEFFTNTPVIVKSMAVKCPKCGTERLLALRGIDDFFV